MHQFERIKELGLGFLHGRTYLVGRSKYLARNAIKFVAGTIAIPWAARLFYLIQSNAAFLYRKAKWTKYDPCILMQIMII